MFEEFYVRLALWWRSRPGPVKAYLARKSFAKTVLVPSVGSIRVAAVQMCPKPAARSLDFAEQIYRLTREAADQGAELVVFPDHVTLPLLALVPGLGQALADSGSLDEALATVASVPLPSEPSSALDPAPPEAGTAVGTPASCESRTAFSEDGSDEHEDGLSTDEDDGAIRLADVVSLATSATDRLYRTVFATLARRFGIHIAAGSALLLQKDGRVLAVSHLFDPHGRVILTQPRTHLRTWERAWGLGSGTELGVADTPLGRIGSLGAGETMLFEPARILWSLGAEIVLSQTADVGVQPPGHFLRGAWARVQESPSYAIQGSLSGEAFGLMFDGTAAIFAPRELTASRDGMMARVTAGYGEEGVVIADLDLNALRSFRVAQPRPMNRSMIGRYLPELYTHPWPWTLP